MRKQISVFLKTSDSVVLSAVLGLKIPPVDNSTSNSVDPPPIHVDFSLVYHLKILLDLNSNFRLELTARTISVVKRGPLDLKCPTQVELPDYSDVL